MSIFSPRPPRAGASQPHPTGRDDRAARTASQDAASTHAADIGRQAPRRDGPADAARTAGADAALALRTILSGRVHGARAALRLLAAVARAFGRRTRRQQFEERRRQRIGALRFRHRLAEVAELDRSAAALGHLTGVVSGLAKPSLATVMVMSDPLSVYTVLRDRLDVAEHVGMLDLSNPKIWICTSIATAVSLVLVFAVVPAGTALATLIFRPRLLTAQGADADAAEFPEAVRSARLLGTREIGALALISFAVLAFFVVVLWKFASARFQEDLAATFGGGDEMGAWLSALIAGLPLVLLAFETLAKAPQLEHARKTARWGWHARLAERRDVWWDQRLLRLEAAAVRVADRRMAALADRLADVALRSDAEAVESAITTGEVDISTLARTHREPVADSGGDRAAPAVDTSGVLPAAYLKGLPVVSNTVALAVGRYGELTSESVPTAAPLVQVWHDLRPHPLAYCPVEDDAAELDCSGERRSQPSPMPRVVPDSADSPSPVDPTDPADPADSADPAA